jgi:hypothetical protein
MDDALRARASTAGQTVLSAQPIHTHQQLGAVPVCRFCGMPGGLHASPAGCVDALRDRIATLEMKLAAFHGRRVSEARRRLQG